MTYVNRVSEARYYFYDSSTVLRGKSEHNLEILCSMCLKLNYLKLCSVNFVEIIICLNRNILVMITLTRQERRSIRTCIVIIKLHK